MVFFTFLCGRSWYWLTILVLWLGFAVVGWLPAQTNPASAQIVPGSLDTNQIPVAPIAILPPDTNAAPAIAAPPSVTVTNVTPPAPAAAATPATSTPTPSPEPTPLPEPEISSATQGPDLVPFPALLALGSLGGFVLYQCGLTRAKNCGHTSTLLLLGVFFALIGYWAGGFAVQNGGIGDMHAALASTPPEAERSALDHELGPMLERHHWGLMGNSGFFLITDETVHHVSNSPKSRGGIAALFLAGAAFLAIAVAAALGAALERGRLLPMAVGSFLIGAILYPLMANWAWGGGWLAELGREFGLGHGFIDQGGAVVVHGTAGTLALVIAMGLGPRYGRVGREKAYRPIPGHNMPFVVLGASLLLVTFTAANTFASETSGDAPEVAAVNTLLAAAGGLLISYLAASWSRKSPQPAALCRGLLGGAVAVSGGSALLDPWAAFIIGVVAGLVVLVAMAWLDWRRIDDPTGASAVHGAAGTWGALAVGLFANGTADGGNGVDGPVRGLCFGGAWHQLAAQAIGAATGFVVVFVLGFICFGLIQKILGTRADLVDEVEGLDWSQTGALGYQPDVEPEDTSRSS